MDIIKDELSNFVTEFNTNQEDKDVNTMWSTFRSKIEQLMKDRTNMYSIKAYSHQTITSMDQHRP